MLGSVTPPFEGRLPAVLEGQLSAYSIYLFQVMRFGGPNFFENAASFTFGSAEMHALRVQ